MAVQLMTKAAYARHRGCDEKAVRKAIVEGRISAIDGKIDPEVADIQWERNTRARVRPSQPQQADLVEAGADVSTPGTQPKASAPGGDDKPTGDPTYMALRVRREAADMERAEIETAKLRGSMVMREDVDRAMFAMGREIRDQLSACARRISSEVAGLTTTEACEEVIDREHRIVLELLAKTFREKVGAPITGGRA